MNVLAAVQDFFRPSEAPATPTPAEVQTPIITAPDPLPYQPSLLHWNASHTQNEERKYCYCGQDRIPDSLSLMCAGCRNWFHRGCVKAHVPDVMPYYMSYKFECTHCSWQKGVFGEAFSLHSQPTWKECTRVALANLLFSNSRTTKSEDRIYYSVAEIAAFMATHWDRICLGRDKQSQWTGSIGSTLYTAAGAPVPVVLADPAEQRSCHGRYTLAETDLYDMIPMTLSGLGRGDVSSKRNLKNSNSECASTSSAGGPPAAKRAKRTPSVPSVASSAVGKERQATPMYIKPSMNEHIFNRNGFRYTDAEPDPFGAAVDDFRPTVQEETSVLLSLQDRAVQLRLSEDRLTVYGDKGYCMARATHFVGPGTWFWEMTVLESDNPDAHVRVGWSQELGPLQGPCGADDFSYSYGDKAGCAFHRSQGKAYGETYSAGDVVGVLLHMPTPVIAELYRGKAKTLAQAAALVAARRQASQPEKPPGAEGPPEDDLQMKVIDYKGLTYIEEKEDREAAVKNLTYVPGSKIVFYKNGVSQGVAFENIAAGEYSPAISLYMGAAVNVNFGPSFLYPPHGILKGQSRDAAPRVRHNGVCERALPALASVVVDDIVGKADSGKWVIRENLPT